MASRWARGWGLLVLCAVGCGRPGLRGADAQFVAEPSVLEFGATSLGWPRSIDVTVRNEGRATFQVFGAATSANEATVDGFESFSLGPGEERRLRVSFSPQLEGPWEGALYIDTDASSAGEDGKAKLPLYGAGVRPQVAVHPARIDFGNVNLGDSKLGQLDVTNTTDTEAQFVVDLEGDDSAMFLPEGLGRVVTLAPRETRIVPVRFTPSRLFAAQARVRVDTCAVCAPHHVELSGFGVAGAVDVQPSRIDFGSIPLGARAEQHITLTNQSSEPVDFSGLDWKDATAFFGVETKEPAVLHPGDSLSAMVWFEPKTAGPVPGAFLRIKARRRGDTTTGDYLVPVTGQVGYACLAVWPRSIDFGTVPEGMTSRRSVQLLNRCPETVRVEGLTTTVASGGFFGAEPLGQTLVLAPNAQGSVTASFTPKPASGTSTGSLSFRVHAGGALSTEAVALTGATRDFAPCQYAMTPGPLDFGQVPPQSEAMLPVVLRNTGSDICFLSSMQLATGTDAAFRASPLGSRPITPGQSVVFPVRFKPPQNGAFSGLVEAWVNHPTQGRATTLLRGEGRSGCLKVEPGAIELGVRKLTCGPTSGAVDLTNTCAQPITVTQLALDTASPELTLQGAPSAPFPLAAGAKLTVWVEYAPLSQGDDVGTLRVETSASDRAAVGVSGRGEVNPQQTDRFVQEGQFKVDMLLVIDNSGSMSEEQNNLAQNFQSLLSAARTLNVDYHLAVTTTGIDPSPGGWSPCPGGAEGGERGRFFPVDNSSPRVLTPTTPNAQQAFAKNVQVGICHWNEQGLEAAYRALSAPLVNQSDDPTSAQPADGNSGFLREDAKLAVVVVSDEEDFSPRTLDFYTAFFRQLKGGDPTKLSFSAVVGPKDLSTCTTASSSGQRYMQLAQQTGGVVESICTPDWASSLGKLSLNAFGPRGTFPLSHTPEDPAQLRVTVNGQPVTGWSYDGAANAIVFDAAQVPPPGSVIEVSYPVGC